MYFAKGRNLPIQYKLKYQNIILFWQFIDNITFRQSFILVRRCNQPIMWNEICKFWYQRNSKVLEHLVFLFCSPWQRQKNLKTQLPFPIFRRSRKRNFSARFPFSRGRMKTELFENDYVAIVFWFLWQSFLLNTNASWPVIVAISPA